PSTASFAPITLFSWPLRLLALLLLTAALLPLFHPSATTTTTTLPARATLLPRPTPLPLTGAPPPPNPPPPLPPPPPPPRLTLPLEPRITHPGLPFFLLSVLPWTLCLLFFLWTLALLATLTLLFLRSTLESRQSWLAADASLTTPAPIPSTTAPDPQS